MQENQRPRKIVIERVCEGVGRSPECFYDVEIRFWDRETIYISGLHEDDLWVSILSILKEIGRSL